MVKFSPKIPRKRGKSHQRAVYIGREWFRYLWSTYLLSPSAYAAPHESLNCRKREKREPIPIATPVVDTQLSAGNTAYMHAFVYVQENSYARKRTPVLSEPCTFSGGT